MTVTINGTTGVSGVAGSASTPALIGSDADSGYYINSANEPNASVNGTAVWNAASTFGFKSRVINGGMNIDQRNAGASVAVTDSSYAVDRFVNRTSQTGKLTAQQTPSATETGYATRVAAGFRNYLAFTSLSAYSPISSDYIGLCHNVEGFNFADMAWGTSSAKTVTLSFWAYSSLTGQMGGAFRNAAQDRSYPFSYTINAANTWEYKTITVPGDTTGTWVGATNGIGVQIWFNLGTGSSSTGAANTWAAAGYINSTGSTAIVGTNGATFYITGVQLEKGSTATSFDFRPYGTELQLCQRYYETNVKIGTVPTNGVDATDRYPLVAFSVADAGMFIKFVVPKRAVPTKTVYAGNNNFSTGGLLTYYNGSSWIQAATTSAQSRTGDETVGFQIDITKPSVLTSGYTYISQPIWTASSEL